MRQPSQANRPGLPEPRVGAGLLAHRRLGTAWAGDPDRGFDKQQPGGWLYNILPYMELQGLHDLGQNGDSANGDYDKDKAAGLWLACTTAVTNYYCPSRHPSGTEVAAGGAVYRSFSNAGYGTFPKMVGQTDYAGNIGNAQQTGGPNGAWPTNAWTPQGIKWCDAQLSQWFRLDRAAR